MTAVSTLSAAEVRRALLTRDLTDQGQGPHAIQMLIDGAEAALADRWDVPIRRVRSNPVVLVDDNYNRLQYGQDAVTRDARYSRYLTDDLMLRSHMSAGIPAALEAVAESGDAEVVLSVPGIVYRRDAIDRQHVGEPHQLDLWRVRARGRALTDGDLEQLIDAVVRCVLPGRSWRTAEAVHPYTVRGRQVDVALGDEWIEVGECGLAHPRVLAGAGLAGATGLASGWGLDRLLMLRKGIDDIRLLRSADPRIASQMFDLRPYEPVSAMPAALRDISIAVDEPPDAELLGDRVRQLLGDDADTVEAVELLSATRGSDLPLAARERLGMHAEQWNALLRVTLRALNRTLTAEEANQVRDRVYTALHRGSAG